MDLQDSALFARRSRCWSELFPVPFGLWRKARIPVAWPVASRRDLAAASLVALALIPHQTIWASGSAHRFRLPAARVARPPYSRRNSRGGLIFARPVIIPLSTTGRVSAATTGWLSAARKSLPFRKSSSRQVVHLAHRLPFQLRFQPSSGQRLVPGRAALLEARRNAHVWRSGVPTYLFTRHSLPPLSFAEVWDGSSTPMWIRPAFEFQESVWPGLQANVV